MARRWKGRPAWVSAVAILTLAVAAGCDDGSGGAASAPTTPAVQALPEGSAAPTDPAAPTVAPAGTVAPKPAAAGAASTPGWPSPEDCVSYNPANVTVYYEAGIYSVNDGSKVVMRLHGQPGGNTGQKGLALAQRFRRHCFIGRTNTREEASSFSFDYWRDASGQTPTIPGQDDDCSDYDRGNLTVEDMGDGNGWRVKDHDHVLHLFDNGTDARNGKLVLARYQHICAIGNGDDQDYVTYLR